MRAWHHCWGPNGTNTYNFQWDIINHQSVVAIMASEGREPFEPGVGQLLTSNSPERFVGAARFTVDNISPHDGGVTFHLTVDWSNALTVWTTILVFDEVQAGMNA